jgi:hypothetical protein
VPRQRREVQLVLIGQCNSGRLEMADRELIAAILTAGMQPNLEIPQSRTQGRSGPLTRVEAEAIQHAVDHALGLYRLLLNGLGVDPFVSEAEPGAQPQAPAAEGQNGATVLSGPEMPRSEEPATQASQASVGGARDLQDRRGNGASMSPARGPTGAGRAGSVRRLCAASGVSVMITRGKKPDYGNKATTMNKSAR